MILGIFLLLGVALIGVQTSPVNANGYTVGCVRCHAVDSNKINVHLIPHSHDDVGWLKTVDQYYFGMNATIQDAGVQYILSSVYEALLENEDRRFIQVETEFFWQWWKHQSEATIANYKMLVENGQIEMVNGAWAMNDEACSNYQSTIDQFTWGLRTLSETLGGCGRPRVGWQIDPFGHSREQASLLAQLGYDGVMFARLDYEDKNKRMKNHSLDFTWQGSANLDDSVIFGSIFATDLYFPPNGFCYDYRCSDDAIDDDPTSPVYNLKDKINNFTEIINTYKEYFPTNNLIIPMGGDFQYEAAEINYKNMDRLIKAFVDNPDINVIYSTPSCYIKAVHDALSTDLELKTDDFFPYSDNNHSFWTGYFTSRPNSKRFERIGHNILQATKQIYAQNTYLTNKTHDENLRFLRETMGVMQHHDAITGTEKQHVANDYVRRLTRGVEYAEKHLGEVFDQLLHTNLSLTISSCLLLNVSICTVSQTSDQFVVFVYNPLAWEVTQYVRLPVEESGYSINGNSEPYDLIPAISNFTYLQLAAGTPSTHELVFAAKQIPPLGFKMYHIEKTLGSQNKSTSKIKSTSSVFSMDPNTNLLQSVTLNGKTLKISQNFNYYYSETGKYDDTLIASGAYLFRPTKTEPETLSNVDVTYTFSGTIVDEVHQKWTVDEADILQIIRWYKDEEYLEFDWIVGNIDIDKDQQGKEIISKFTVIDEFDNGNVFYTDSNGREMIKRIKNSRPDYTYDASIEPVASNYYPVTSRIVIKDETNDVEVAVLTDRSQGGSSLKRNEIELMVHRRLTNDDSKGVGENLNETEFGLGTYVRGSHYLVIGKASGTNPNGKTTAGTERILAQKKLLQPWMGLATIDKSYEELKELTDLTYEGLTTSLPENINILTFEPWIAEEYLLRLEHIMEKNEDENLSNIVNLDIVFSLLNNIMPDNVNILTLEPWHNNSYLLRLEHIMEKDEDPLLSKSATVPEIKSLFKHIQVTKITEMTLAAHLTLDELDERGKYSWIVANKSTSTPAFRNIKANGEITLNPMEIRIFILDT